MWHIYYYNHYYPKNLTSEQPHDRKKYNCLKTQLRNQTVPKIDMLISHYNPFSSFSYYLEFDSANQHWQSLLSIFHRNCFTFVQIHFFFPMPPWQVTCLIHHIGITMLIKQPSEKINIKHYAPCITQMNVTKN